MIAADTSSLVAYFSGDPGPDVEKLVEAISIGHLVLPPIVVTEILSDPDGAPAVGAQIKGVPQLEPIDGYWERAGETRRLLRRHGLRAKVGDAPIAQSCIDHDVALITRDRDFRHFAEHCGLKLA